MRMAMAGALDLWQEAEGLGLFQLGEEPAEGDLTAAPFSACGGVTEETVSSHVHSRRIRDSGPKVKQEYGSWMQRNKNFTQTIIKQHSRLPQEVVQSPPLEFLHTQQNKY